MAQFLNVFGLSMKVTAVAVIAQFQPVEQVHASELHVGGATLWASVVKISGLMIAYLQYPTIVAWQGTLDDQQKSFDDMATHLQTAVQGRH